MTTKEDSSSITHETQVVITRYRNGYRVAGTLDGVGSLAQGGGAVVVIGGIVFVIFGPSGAMTWIAGSVAVLIGFVFLLLGTLVSAVGQGIKASFDTAVHTSPFLTEGQKSLSMSL